MEREARRGETPDPEKSQLKRRANAALRAAKINTEVVDVKVPATERHCPECGGEDFAALGDGKPSSVTEYIQGYFRKRIFRRETLACSCGGHVVTAPVPDKVVDRTQYGPGFMAHLVVSKCCDSMPLYRMEQQFGRLGIPMSRSTMTDLFHRTGELVAPLAARILELIAQSEIVLADETPMPVQDARKKPYIWTFVAGNFIGCDWPSKSVEIASEFAKNWAGRDEASRAATASDKMQTAESYRSQPSSSRGRADWADHRVARGYGPRNCRWVRAPGRSPIGKLWLMSRDFLRVPQM